MLVLVNASHNTGIEKLEDGRIKYNSKRTTLKSIYQELILCKDTPILSLDFLPKNIKILFVPSNGGDSLITTSDRLVKQPGNYYLIERFLEKSDLTYEDLSTIFDFYNKYFEFLVVSLVFDNTGLVLRNNLGQIVLYIELPFVAGAVGKKILDYASAYAGTPTYDEVMKAIEFGYKLGEENS